MRSTVDCHEMKMILFLIKIDSMMKIEKYKTVIEIFVIEILMESMETSEGIKKIQLKLKVFDFN